MRTVLVVACTTVVLACSDSLAPQDVVGSYVALSFDGALPGANLSLTSHGCAVRNQGATLDLLADGHFHVYIARVMACPGAAPTYPDLAIGGYFRVKGRQLILDPASPMDPSLTALLRGTHLFIGIPNVAGAGTASTLVEFAAGSVPYTPARPAEPGIPPPPSPSDNDL